MGQSGSPRFDHPKLPGYGSLFDVLSRIASIQTVDPCLEETLIFQHYVREQVAYLGLLLVFRLDMMSIELR